MRLSGMREFPDPHEEKEALRELIDVLEGAARTEEEAARIITECVQYSGDFCPTPFALRRIASDLRAKKTSWTPDTRTCPAGLCDGHGWARVFFLVTEDRHGDSHYRRRERITADVYAKLTPEVDNQKQRLYEAVEPCPCTPRASAPEAA